jgi:hypothetical protein
MLFNAEERVAPGLYLCTKCGAKIKLYNYGDILKPCSICGYKKYIKFSLDDDIPCSNP